MDWNFIFNIEDGQWHPENWPSTSDPHTTVNHTHFFEADPSWIDSWPTDHASGDIPETAPPGDLTNARETLHFVSAHSHEMTDASIANTATQNPQEISEPSPTALNPPSSPQLQRRQPSSPPNSGGSPQKKRKHQRKTKTSPKEKRQRKKSTNRGEGEGTTSAASAAAAAASSHHHHRHHQPPFPLSPIQTAFPPPPQSTTSPNHISNSTTGASTTTTTTTTANTTATTNTPTTAPRPASIDLTVVSPAARLPHKAVEKKYRDGIKALFRRLRLALPAGPPPSPPHQLRQDGRASSPPSLTKAGIIARAIEYIQQLEAERGAARQRCDELARENERLRRRVRDLEEERADKDEHEHEDEHEYEQQQQQKQRDEVGMREAVAGFSGVFDSIAGPAAGGGDAGAQGRQQQGFGIF